MTEKAAYAAFLLFIAAYCQNGSLQNRLLLPSLIFFIKFIEYLLHGYPAVSGNQKEYRMVITRQVIHWLLSFILR
ncbi:hypothetical protein JHW33_19740 [Rahnella aceris]|uniref:hypothetical protein n=1 Tax=Rahnella sp. (strain Y9602) TaxID=2703885 RepID=UPI001906B326|nr:hypothetical protein [Rahnella aceris]QQN34614.1 hypothetical protein JHW33_19740 [Rahnella aceris]